MIFNAAAPDRKSCLQNFAHRIDETSCLDAPASDSVNAAQLGQHFAQAAWLQSLDQISAALLAV